MSQHPLRKLIFESLVHSPQGFELDPKRVRAITDHLRGNDPATVTAFYETVGMLEVGNGRPAASALLKLVIDTPAAKARPGGWGPR